MVAVRDTYKGHSVLKLEKVEGSKYPFTFGVAKAELILEHIEDIREFVAASQKEKVESK